MALGTLIRPVTLSECHWLDTDLPAGKTVYRYSGHTYGCITPSGVAVTDQYEVLPFYEVPDSAVSWADDD